MRKSHIIEAHVRAQLIKHKVTKEGEHLPFFQTELKVKVLANFVIQNYSVKSESLKVTVVFLVLGWWRWGGRQNIFHLAHHCSASDRQ